MLTAALIFAHLTNAHPYHVDHTDEELAVMDTESLLHVEHDLRQQNKIVDKHIASLHGKLTKAEEKQKQLAREFKKLESGRDWEGRQKVNKEKELSMAKAEMETKRDQMATISAHADQVRKQIRELEAKMQSLSLQKQADEVRFANPTILDVVDAKVEQMSPTVQRVLNKTLHTLIFPGLSSGASGAEHLRSHLRSSTQHMAIASTFAIYAFIICLIALVFRAYRQITGNLTLTKIIFTGDMCFTAFWCFICLWGVGLLDDPLIVMKRHNESISIAVQLTIGAAVLLYIAVRCLSLAATLHAREGLELIFALFIVQHFYGAIWAPSLTDQDAAGGAGVYLGYATGHLLLAARRARSQVLGEANHCYDHSKLGPMCDDSCEDGEEPSQFVWWFVAQMRQVALLVESIFFTVTSKVVSEEEVHISSGRTRRKSKRSKVIGHDTTAMKQDRARED